MNFIVFSMNIQILLELTKNLNQKIYLEKMKKLKQCRAGFWTEATALGSMARYGGQAGLDG
jgi:hypothetical protein